LDQKHSVALQEQAAWCIGNIAGEDQELRESLLKQSLLPSLVRLFDSTSLNLIKVSAWTLSNLLKGSTQTLSLELFIKAGVLPLLLKQLKSCTDDEVLCEIVWLFSKIGSIDEKVTSNLVGGNVIPLLVNRMKTNNPSLLIPILNSLGNILTYNHDYVGILLSQKEFLPQLKKLSTS